MGEQRAQEHRRAGARRSGSPDGAAPSRAAPPLSLPDKPSIAVLPFTNMSGDPEQQYFSDGITEDIITELSRFRSLFVIARNSSFQYRDKAVDVRRVARELGVRYVVEGSVRKMGEPDPHHRAADRRRHRQSPVERALRPRHRRPFRRPGRADADHRRHRGGPAGGRRNQDGRAQADRQPAGL